jgi:nucleotide-binding universal stress UspA family protein
LDPAATGRGVIDDCVGRGEFPGRANYFARTRVFAGSERAFFRGNSVSPSGGIFASLPRMIAIERILVATDFSPASESALRYGRELARGFGADLHVLHVTENVFTRAADAYSYVPIEVQQELEADSRRDTEALLDDEDRRDLHAVAATVTSNSTADAIVEYARAHRVSLIIIGTHGRGAVARFFLGSVAERVVRTAACPVLTVHSPEQEFVHPDALVPADAQTIRLRRKC